MYLTTNRTEPIMYFGMYDTPTEDKPAMEYYWVDVTLKVKAESEEMAAAILTDSLQNVESLYEGQVAIKAINWEDEEV